VSRRLALLLLSALAGCSGLQETEAGVVQLDVTVPGPDSVEVGESIQLSAKPLDKNGDSVGTPVTWLSADATATIDAATGVLTGVAPGSARVQASVGSLSSELITFAVVAPADTLVLPGDSVLTVPAGTGTSTDMLTRLDSFNPPGPLPGRRVLYAITSPDPAAAPPAVVFNTGAVADTVTTGADGTAAAVLAVIGAPPDTVIVEARATRTRGAVVPGSGQRFIVLFQH
jgi:Big-like domain-containing protein